MTAFIILSRADMLSLCNDKPVTVYVDKKPYVLCTDEYFEKQRTEPHAESEGRAIEIQNILTQLHKEYRDTENGAAGEDVRWWNAGIRRAIEIVERSDKE